MIRVTAVVPVADEPFVPDASLLPIVQLVYRLGLDARLDDVLILSGDVDA